MLKRSQNETAPTLIAFGGSILAQALIWGTFVLPRLWPAVSP